MKNKYKLLSLVEISILSCFLFSAKKYFKEIRCTAVECEVVDDKDNVVDVDIFMEIFNPLREKEMVGIDLMSLRKKIKENRIVDEVKILKKKDKIFVEIKPHKILGVAYYNFIPAVENSEESIKRDPEFILDNGEKVSLKLKEEKNFIPVICEDDVKIVDILPVLSFINSNSKVKSMINTISLKKGNFYVTTILNDSFINLGSFFDTKSIICRICDVHKILYLGNDFSRIELSDNVLFLQKKRI